ncbi:MAG: class I SAM-dependent methyltransferase [Planctomycetes bacterium]|nr:class I SAM-dependent methyltransferase [Planctomycetota bacterium]
MKRHFDRIGHDYDKYHPEHIQKFYYSVRMSSLEKYLKSDSLILDLGCGTGRHHLWYSQKGFTLVGAEPSFELVKIAKTRNNKMVQADAFTLPFACESFDCVLIVSVLHHLGGEKNVMKVLYEIDRVVKSGGYIFLIDHNVLCPYVPILLKTFPTDRDDPNVMAISQFFLQKVLRNMNYEVQKLVYYGWVPNIIPQSIMFLFRSLETILAQIPLVKMLSAQYIVVARKISNV